MATRLTPSAGNISFEDFLSEYDGVHAEWVDGQVFVMTPAKPHHWRLTRFLGSVIQSYAEDRGLGEVFGEPVTMRTNERAGREPDLYFVAAENAHRMKEAFFDGPADLVIEIVSRESRTRDRKEKFGEYERAGVREYWLIDPERRRADACRLTDAGRYEAVELGEPAVLRSHALPGMWVAVEWLRETPLPRQSWVLQQWGPV
jgi:Uma2 family endonuclease